MSKKLRNREDKNFTSLIELKMSDEVQEDVIGTPYEVPEIVKTVGYAQALDTDSIKNKAIILENFSMPVPMQGHLSTICNVTFKIGQEITDDYTINYLKTTSKANLVKFI